MTSQLSLLRGKEGAGSDFNIRPGTLARLRNLHPQLNRRMGSLRIVSVSGIVMFQKRD